LEWLDIAGIPIESISFDDAEVGEEYLDTIYLKNLDTIPHTVNCERIFLKRANSFEIVEGGGTEIEIGPNQQHRIVLSYKPTVAGTFGDTLYAFTTCLYFQIPILANAEDITFTVDLLVEPENTGTTEGDGTYYKNETVTITANAKEGFMFVNWTANDTEISTENPYTFTITQDTILTANFEIDTVGIVENKLISGIRIIPNPVSSDAIIEINCLASQPNTAITILDISGGEILTVHTGLLDEGVNNFPLPNSFLANGSYILLVKNTFGQKMERFVIAR
jgi:hypothetical protein